MNTKNISLIMMTLCLLSSLAAAQQSTTVELPRTPDGKPDLQGIWTNATQTTLERPARFGDRRFMTAEEAQQMQQDAQGREVAADAPSDPNRAPPSDGNTAAAYNTFWLDRGTQVTQIDGEYRTSMIIDPPDGKIPWSSYSSFNHKRLRMRGMRPAVLRNGISHSSNCDCTPPLAPAAGVLPSRESTRASSLPPF